MVVPGARELHQTKALLELMTPGGGKAFPENPWTMLPPYPAQSADPGRWAGRWAGLYGLARGSGARGVLLSVDNLLPKWPPVDVLDHHHLILSKGEELLLDDLLEQFALWGYERVTRVSRPGEIAMRGDILDLYAPGYDNPLRFEFFGDSLEDIRLFDATTQRSRTDIQQAVILPCAPALLTPPLVEAAQAKWKRLKGIGELSGQACEELERRVESTNGMTRPGLFYENPTALSQWLPRDAVWLLCGAGTIRTRLDETEWAWTGRLDEEADQHGWRPPRAQLLETGERARQSWMDRAQIHFEDLTIGDKKDGAELPEKAIHSFDDLFWKPEERNRPWHALLDSLRKWTRERPQTILSFRNEASRRKFMKLAAQDDVVPAMEYAPDRKGLFALISPMRKGLELSWSHVLVLSEDVLQPTPRGARLPGSDKKFKGMSSHEDLSVGDLLVHRDWGLSRFEGLHRLELGGVSNDYLLLIYSGEDKLYLPVDRLDVVQRFKGPEGTTPVLDKMGGAAWTRAKSRARKAVEKIAQGLVEMYAYRQVVKGHAYAPGGDEYAEFEASFGFEETPDQEAAIRDVMADMDKPAPMDRLVCGDVGFGKTEVAMRAAFRAAMGGHQVALLCPTTVLAEQHYQNFRRRMEGFPLQVAMLSRFVTRNSQKLTLEAAARGQVDVLIGTHRMLSKDVNLPNLGLLILDEEQRFGVRHKERIKELRKNIDVLTLTATPIPRTLQLSLAGIRGLSVMETPPLDRKPVRTSILEREKKPLGAMLARELERDGQVFWVHNRVKSLPRVVEYVQELAPGARIGLAHGQMKERELEETIHQFWHGELDILVCTAIIESGLDFPRANTLIVDQAQMFGLGQLYQLRGRVGRSSRQAYACFVIPSLDGLPELSRKRLQVILDMDYLGAGFKVAMEDLRLRGAGNILGEAQSGTVAKVGLDLYLEMLEEEVRRIRGEDLVQETSPELNFMFEAHIPEEYIPDTQERLRYYKALSSAADPAALEELTSEVRDQFGVLPVPLERFLAVLRFKRLLGRLQVAKADVSPVRAVLTWAEGATVVTSDRIVAFVQENGHEARLLPPGRLEIRVQTDGSVRQGLSTLEKALTALLPGATTPGNDKLPQ
ncbi:transcription-repair coupling factor [Desulfovibrio ferrophilus]|uniref:Transcription-repair-coupling factor n=1 Tax=Desulfovibrio ferrophilus TaxID=241368 RepID=A0A2Z6AWQ4_9BACT|nr:transcription-repair coupling factor [Desulfovibrio ferrophilus]BBD07616.1 transcription-repair-coupling factor [Desulfovibrio ferrophilus]